MNTHNMFSWRNKKKIRTPPFIWSYCASHTISDSYMTLATSTHPRISDSSLLHIFTLNPFTSSGLFYHNSLNWSLFPIAGCMVIIFILFIEISALNANSIDPDQMSHSAVSDLGLHCLLVMLLGCSD